jgi:prepilin-type processing-associated H-X9-DG protein
MSLESDPFLSVPRPGANRVGKGRRAVSLNEVLIVCSLVIFMLALLVPGLGHARERARRLICKNNLRQWGVATQLYRDDHMDYIPHEGYGGDGMFVRGTWYNELPAYLGLPAYAELEGVNAAFRELPEVHPWICPSKNVSAAYKSVSGKNQFHYGMNDVLDGMGDPPDGSDDTPGFPDERDPDKFASARWFARRPTTVLLFDIYPNSPHGSPRDVATRFQRTPQGIFAGRFHGDYANLLYLDGTVGHCQTNDLVTERHFRNGRVIWDHPRLYWGYPPSNR